jgi:hypothetical protein
MNNKVLAQVAYAPTGPWSDPVTLYQATPITNGSSIYAAVPHPYHDETGKTLVVTFTNHPNLIQAAKIVGYLLYRPHYGTLLTCVRHLHDLPKPAAALITLSAVLTLHVRFPTLCSKTAYGSTDLSYFGSAVLMEHISRIMFWFDILMLIERDGRN